MIKQITNMSSVWCMMLIISITTVMGGGDSGAYTHLERYEKCAYQYIVEGTDKIHRGAFNGVYVKMHKPVGVNTMIMVYRKQDAPSNEEPLEIYITNDPNTNTQYWTLGYRSFPKSISIRSHNVDGKCPDDKELKWKLENDPSGKQEQIKHITFTGASDPCEPNYPAMMGIAAGAVATFFGGIFAIAFAFTSAPIAGFALIPLGATFAVLYVAGQHYSGAYCSSAVIY